MTSKIKILTHRDEENGHASRKHEMTGEMEDGEWWLAKPCTRAW